MAKRIKKFGHPTEERQWWRIQMMDKHDQELVMPFRTDLMPCIGDVITVAEITAQVESRHVNYSARLVTIWVQQ